MKIKPSQEGQPHEELQKITDSMKKVIYRGDKCSIDQDIDIGSLIPSKHHFSSLCYCIYSQNKFNFIVSEPHRKQFLLDI